MRTLNDIHGATDEDISFYLAEVDVKEFRKHLSDFNGEQRSLRDWFAGMALQGINAAPMNRFPELKNETDTAIAAYTMADAMIAARKEAR